VILKDPVDKRETRINMTTPQSPPVNATVEMVINIRPEEPLIKDYFFGTAEAWRYWDYLTR
jgi:hypothetical protein